LERAFFVRGEVCPAHKIQKKRKNTMALYLISYDIAEKDAWEYQPLYDLLEAWGAKRILYSEWIVTNDTGQAASIYNEIAPLTQQKDRLLVQEITKDASWDKLMITDAAFNRFIESARG
jgi:CRISPR/Cas system-associated endoribonuclease Cas2